MKTGTIHFYNRVDKLIDSKRYKDVARRYEIIAKWKLLYSVAFRNCSFIIEPDVNTAMVKKNGQNKKGWDFPYSETASKRNKEIEITKFARPTRTSISKATREEYNRPSH